MDEIIVAVITGLFVLAGNFAGSLSGIISGKNERIKEKMKYEKEAQNRLKARKEEIYMELLRAMRAVIDREPERYLEYYQKNNPFVLVYGSKEMRQYAEEYRKLTCDYIRCKELNSDVTEIMVEVIRRYDQVVTQIREELICNLQSGS